MLQNLKTARSAAAAAPSPPTRPRPALGGDPTGSALTPPGGGASLTLTLRLVGVIVDVGPGRAQRAVNEGKGGRNTAGGSRRARRSGRGAGGGGGLVRAGSRAAAGLAAAPLELLPAALCIAPPLTLLRGMVVVVVVPVAALVPVVGSLTVGASPSIIPRVVAPTTPFPAISPLVA